MFVERLATHVNAAEHASPISSLSRRRAPFRSALCGVQSRLVEPRFFCDAMLGGLARWLRAAGYDAAFEQGIDDGVLVARAGESGRILLSSDGGIFERTVVREGRVRSLFVPRALGLSAQLRFVFGALSLSLLPPRCMNCGGALAVLTKDEARGEAPPKTLERIETFYRCEGCGKLLWRGSHWERITRVLAEAETAALTAAGRPDEPPRS